MCHCLGANETQQGPREGRDDWDGEWVWAGRFRLGMAEMANDPREMCVPGSTEYDIFSLNPEVAT